MNHPLVLLLAIPVLGLAPVTAESPRRIYLSNDDHTDFMWTADAATYEKVFVEMLDFHLKLADETAGNPSPYRNRFNADGSYWLWTYERKKTPEEFARLIGRIKDGTISAPLNALVSCYGGQPAEAVLRGMYYAGQLERKHGLRFTQAVSMENQTLPLGLASLWAGSGAKYSWRGICGCASKMDPRGWAKRDHEIYWCHGHDGQRLLMKSHSLQPGGNRGAGGYAEAFDPAGAVRFLDGDADFLKRYRAPGITEPYQVRGAFGYGWDALDRKTGQTYDKDPKNYPKTDHFHVVAKMMTTPERQVIVSNQEDFFRDFETTHGKDLPAEGVTTGNEWDLYSASMSETSAAVKRAVEKLRAAEAMASLVSLKNRAFLKGREASRDQAFMNLGLYWEHDWTADGPVPREARAAWQEVLAAQIDEYVDTLHRDAAAALGKLIAKDGGARRFHVLNPLGWQRTDAADLPYEGAVDIHVHDLAAGADTPHQFVMVNGVKQLRILARDLPSVGYKVFEIRPGPGAAITDAATVSEGNTVLENSRVRITVAADGSIRSFIDNARPGDDLAATIGGLALNDFTAGSTHGEPITVTNRGPVSVTLSCRAKGTPATRTAITMFRDSDRVEIRNEILGNFADVRHWSFGFNLKSPMVRTEEVGAVITVKNKADAGDYADRNARYDYATLNHFADIADDGAARGVTLSNSDLAFVKLGASTSAELDIKTPQLHVLAGGQVDGGNLGIKKQNGHEYFLQRFALRPHDGYSATAAMKFSLEHQNPPVTGEVGGQGDAAYPATSYSLIQASHPDALLWALKPHEDGVGNGLVARVWNQSNRATALRLSLAVPLKGARSVSHIETPGEALPLKDGALQTAVPAHRMASFLLQPAATP